MNKMSDLAATLVDKYGLNQKDAEHFVASMFDVINDGLQSADRMVKVKGLGTFKLTSVSPRESVDVNTGERIVIDGRDKISFTPETALRDRVNQPFSQFETVVLNDGVNFSDGNDTSVDENKTDNEDESKETYDNTEQDSDKKETPSDETANEVVKEEAILTKVEAVPKENTDTKHSDEKDSPDGIAVSDKAGKEEERISDVPSSDTPRINVTVENEQETVTTEKEKNALTENNENDSLENVTESEIDGLPLPDPLDRPDIVARQLFTDSVSTSEEDGIDESRKRLSKAKKKYSPRPSDVTNKEEIQNNENTKLAAEAPSTEQNVTETKHKDVCADDENESHRKDIAISILSALLFAALLSVAFVAYYFNDYAEEKQNRISELEAMLSDSRRTAAQLRQRNIKEKPATANYDINSQVSNNAGEKRKAVSSKEKQQGNSKNQTSSTEQDAHLSSHYNADARVRTGAYIITGVSNVVTVKSGQTLASISRHYLGPGMECYVEAVNGVTEVKAGDKLKIPELTRKRKAKK